jgi:hypothetical protein
MRRKSYQRIKATGSSSDTGQQHRSCARRCDRTGNKITTEKGPVFKMTQMREAQKVMISTALRKMFFKVMYNLMNPHCFIPKLMTKHSASGDSNIMTSCALQWCTGPCWPRTHDQWSKGLFSICPNPYSVCICCVTADASVRSTESSLQEHNTPAHRCRRHRSSPVPVVGSSCQVPCSSFHLPAHTLETRFGQ